MMTTWYTEIEVSKNISQGDIFFNFPIFNVNPGINFGETNWHEKITLDIFNSDVVVMTQACDLERNPADTVLLVRIDDIKNIVIPPPPNGESITRKSHLKSIYNGKKPNLHVIGKREEMSGININYQIVDFSTVFAVPYTLIQDFKEHHGSRLRLNTPHREYLSQRFGNFYTRIGLPNNDHISEDDLLKGI